MHGQPVLIPVQLQGRPQVWHVCAHLARDPRGDEMPAESQEKPPLQPEPHDGEDFRWEEEQRRQNTRAHGEALPPSRSSQRTRTRKRPRRARSSSGEGEQIPSYHDLCASYHDLSVRIRYVSHCISWIYAGGLRSVSRCVSHSYHSDIILYQTCFRCVCWGAGLYHIAISHHITSYHVIS
jgi:hypothetical protein